MGVGNAIKIGVSSIAMFLYIAIDCVFNKRGVPWRSISGFNGPANPPGGTGYDMSSVFLRKAIPAEMSLIIATV